MHEFHKNEVALLWGTTWHYCMKLSGLLLKKATGDVVEIKLTGFI